MLVRKALAVAAAGAFVASVGLATHTQSELDRAPKHETHDTLSQTLGTEADVAIGSGTVVVLALGSMLLGAGSPNRRQIE